MMVLINSGEEYAPNLLQLFKEWYESNYTIIPEMLFSEAAKYGGFATSDYSQNITKYSEDNDDVRHSLRMAAFGWKILDLPWPEHDPIKILDFGCGIGQNSLLTAKLLIEKGNKVQLSLVDICEHRQSFAKYQTAVWKIPKVSGKKFDVILIQEVMEHLSDPVAKIIELDAQLQPGGLFFGNLNNHLGSGLHVYPDLLEVRQWLKEAGYRTLIQKELFQKPIRL